MLRRKKLAGYFLLLLFECLEDYFFILLLANLFMLSLSIVLY